MFIHYFQKPYLFFVLLSVSTLSFGDIYKWVDENGQTHYTQSAPRNQKFEEIKTPPPPSIKPGHAQRKVDKMIAIQENKFNQYEQQQADDERQRLNLETAEKNCTAAKYNLQQYQNHPRADMIDAEGNRTSPNEEQRQKTMAGYQQDIDTHCQ